MCATTKAKRPPQNIPDFSLSLRHSTQQLEPDVTTCIFIDHTTQSYIFKFEIYAQNVKAAIKTSLKRVGKTD